MSQDLLKYRTALITTACGFGEGFQVYHTWNNMEVRRIILIQIYDGRPTFVQTLFTAGTVWVPNCVSNMNTHGSLVDFTVLRTWMHIDLQSWLYSALVMNAREVVSECVSILNTHEVIRQNSLYSQQNIILLSMGFLFQDY
jgi:hypothetical protein